MPGTLLERIADGRTDLVFEYVTDGHAATATDGAWRSSSGAPTTAM